MNGRQGGDTQVQRLLPDGDHRPPVLGYVFLGDVHTGHNFQAGDHRVLQLPGYRDDGPQRAVDAHADGHAALSGLQVDVAGPLGTGPVDDGVYQADGRGGIRLVLVHRQALRLGGGAVLAAQQVPAHVLYGLHGPLVAVQILHRPLQRGGCGNHRDDPAAGHCLDLLHRHKVQRVGHGQLHVGPVGSDGDHHMLFRNALWQDLRHLRRDRAGVQVYKLHAKLIHQGVDQLLFGNKSVLLQHLAQPLAGAFLQFQRPVQLRLGDGPALDQQVTQLDVFHGSLSFFSGFRQRTVSSVSAWMSPSFSLTDSFSVKTRSA